MTYIPDMPCDLNSKYSEWKVVFEAIIKEMRVDDTLTLIGHSLGGCFLLKYFSEIQEFPHKIESIHLIAACIEEGDFRAPRNYDFLKSLGIKVHIWHAEDDTIVPFSIGKELSKILSEAQTHFFSAEKCYDHFHKLEYLLELEAEIFG
jgi:predicted alpha/beta hydrolase family esterase